MFDCMIVKILLMIFNLILILSKSAVSRPKVSRHFSLQSITSHTMSGIIDSVTHGGYIDAHAHLIHEQFEGEEDSMAIKCKERGIDFVIVNGLEPTSNRKILEYSERHSNILPALGIYPLEAVCNIIHDNDALTSEEAKNIVNYKKLWNFDFPPPNRFSVDDEIDFIDLMAGEKKIIAIGECGLDRHYLTDDKIMAEQERVLRRLFQVAKKHDIPVILHSRKAEQRVFELLLEEGVQKADMHCFCGKVSLGVKMAEHGYYFSIPSAIERSKSFQSLVRALPMENILTETDCPYMGPDKGVRNDPTTVPRGVAAISIVKKISEEEAKLQIRKNFNKLFFNSSL